MRHLSFVVISSAIILASCNNVPSYVIQPDEMAELLADVRMADAVITVQPTAYGPDAKKAALKDEIFRSHGVTSEQFDTSLVWYGHNMEKFQDVNEMTIEILERRLKEANALTSGDAAMTVAGDSVDLWNGNSYYEFSKKLPSQYLSFSYDADPNWEPGDIYTLRSRMVLPGSSAQWNLTTEYEDGAVDIITMVISQTDPNRQEISLYTDSTRIAKRLSGWMKIVPSGSKPAIIDSISLTRRRIDQGVTGHRLYQQKMIEPKKIVKDEAETDSTATEQ